jgi:hypothetical protein
MGQLPRIYTAVGGLQQYTDTIQWISSLIADWFYRNSIALGRWWFTMLIKATAPEYLSQLSFLWHQILNWSVTIIPIGLSE